MKRLEADRDRYRLTLEGLTPGGSEYVRDPERCEFVIRERMAGPLDLLKRMKRERDSALALLRELAAATDSLMKHLNGFDLVYVGCLTDDEILAIQEKRNQIHDLLRRVEAEAGGEKQG